MVAYETGANNLADYGLFDRNYYARPFEDQFKIRILYNPGSGLTGADLSLNEWQTRFGQDRNSFNSPITYKLQTTNQTGASLLNHAFSGNISGWGWYSPYGNGRADWDNTNRLDGGSLRLSFTSPANQTNSYLLATVGIGSVVRGKTYQVLFDGVASAANKRVQVYPRQAAGSYRDLATRATFALGQGRQLYEATFTATADESNAILVVQVQEDGQTAWFDNIRLLEATAVTTLNPDDYTKIVYNPTFQNRTETLDGVYRDAKNNVYDRSVTVPPFSSVVLIKENGTPPPTPTNTPTPPPPAPVSLRDPENPANAVAGLDYQYYEGSWSALPNFDALTPVKTGTTNALTPATVRNRSDNFGLRYRGYVSVPTDGNYTFYTTSDDGSKLYIGDRELVSNDGLHGMQERAGDVGLKAGVHALTIVYFQGTQGQGLAASYRGPGINKQTIPDAAFRRVSTPTTTPPPTTPPTGTGTGLRAEFFNNRDLNAPLILNRIDATVDVDWGSNSPAAGVNNDNFSARWTGQVEAPVTGSYVFSTITDDGVRLWINGVQVINDWNGHPPKTNNSPSVALTADQKYDIRMEYFEGSGGAVARLRWSHPGQSQEVVPKERLYPAAAPARLAAAGADELTFGLADFTIVYPVPAYDEFRSSRTGT